MDWQERIVSDAEVGKMVVKGTRVTVDTIIDLLGRGYSKERILQQHDGLTAEDIKACVSFDEWRQSALIDFD